MTRHQVTRSPHVNAAVIGGGGSVHNTQVSPVPKGSPLKHFWTVETPETPNWAQAARLKQTQLLVNQHPPNGAKRLPICCPTEIPLKRDCRSINSPHIG